jgi:hypothetical protein
MATGTGEERVPAAATASDTWTDSATTVEGGVFDEERFSTATTVLGLASVVLKVGVGSDGGGSVEAFVEVDP